MMPGRRAARQNGSSDDGGADACELQRRAECSFERWADDLNVGK
jgi:hypothetical protein